MKRTFLMGLFLCCILLAVHKAQANEVDTAIAKAAHKYSIDVRLMRAIASVETNMGASSLLRRNKNGTYDLGLYQINSVNWPLCKHLDLISAQGNAECAALILARHKHASKGATYWTAYHSKTPSRAAQYEARVRKVLQRQADGYTLYSSK